jgi:hypothetical protein
MQVTLIGIDPGIRDTGIVSIHLDTIREKWHVTTQVWNDVTHQERLTQTISPDFLDEITAFVDHENMENKATFVGIEGYRQRGNDVRQDQRMLALVNAIHDTLKGSHIVDNTGIKNVVTEPMLKLFKVDKFHKTFHADLKSAARVALKLGINNEVLNRVLSDFVRDNLNGTPWQSSYTEIV